MFRTILLGRKMGSPHETDLVRLSSRLSTQISCFIMFTSNPLFSSCLPISNAPFSGCSLCSNRLFSQVYFDALALPATHSEQVQTLVTQHCCTYAMTGTQYTLQPFFSC